MKYILPFLLCMHRGWPQYVPVHASFVILLLNPSNSVVSNLVNNRTLSGELAIASNSAMFIELPTPTAYTVAPDSLRAVAVGMVISRFTLDCPSVITTATLGIPVSTDLAPPLATNTSVLSRRRASAVLVLLLRPSGLTTIMMCMYVKYFVYSALCVRIIHLINLNIVSSIILYPR